MNKGIAARWLVIVTLLSLTACYKHGDPAPAPGNVTVAAGDESATVSWTPDSGVTYWVWCAQGTSITTDNAFSLPGLRIVTDATTPSVVAGLVNGTNYACMVNGRYNGGPGGPGSASVSIVPRLAGATWTVNTVTLGTGTIRGAASGSTFVAVGDAGAIFTSTDGKTWTTVSPPTANIFYAATYGGSYVAVGQGGVVFTSADAATWTVQTSGTTNDLLALATTGGGYYVAVGQAGTILYSSGGTTWTAPTTSPALATENLTGVAYGTLSTGTTYFVAVSDQGRILTSTDGGVTWTSQTQTSPLYAVTYGVDTTVTPNVAKFVAVGASGAVLTSTDGTTWTSQTALGTSNLRSVTFGRQFIAVGDSGNIFTSASAIDTSWAQQTSGVTTQNLLAIAHNSIASAPFGYVAVGTSGTNLTSY